jgi:hypothetical protein
VIKINDRYTFTDKSGAQLFSMFLCGKIKGRGVGVEKFELKVEKRGLAFRVQPLGCTCRSSKLKLEL